MATFVLIHGAWHGGWCWHKTVASLEAAGHTALAPDLAGLGDDTTPLADVTLAGWADDVADLVRAQDEPVVLVGHSRGGVVISEVAERVPDRVACLVYLTAMLLQSGEAGFDAANTDNETELGANLVIDQDNHQVTVNDDVVREVFYGGCSDTDVAYARARLRPEPLGPVATPLALTDANFGSVPRTYLRCLQDKALSPALQQRMIDASPCARVIDLDTDHSPFFSANGELTQRLIELS